MGFKVTRSKVTWSMWILTILLQGTVANHFHHEEGHYDYELELDGHEMGSAVHGMETHGHHHGQDGDDEGEGQGGSEIPLGDEEPIGSEEEEEEAPLHLVRQIDQSTPAISLTGGVGYNGPELFFDGSRLSLPWTFAAKSHRLKGRVNWTIYPGKNFTGNPFCLVADPGHHVTSNGNHLVTVGSIRRGCWCNDSMMVTPRPRSQGRLVSGVQLWASRNAEGAAVYTDGRETRLPYPFDMASFQLLGRWIPWTLFGAPDLTGDSSCLVADPEGEGKSVNYVFTNIPKPFRVSSVQQACVASSAFEFAGVDKGAPPVKGGKISDNEIPVIPGGGSRVPGGGGGGKGPGSEIGGTGGQGSEDGGRSGGPRHEDEGENETTEKAKAKGRNGKAGDGNLKTASSVLISFVMGVVVVFRN